MKYLIFFLCVIHAEFTFSQQTTFAMEFLPVWQSPKACTIELAEKMPDSLYDYQPTPAMRTFRQQMIHIGHSITWMYQYIIKNDRSGLPIQPNTGDFNKEEVIHYLENQFHAGEELLLSLSAEELERRVSYFDYGELSVEYAFISIHDHIVNHRAKANLYLRLCDLTPPEYTFLKMN